VREVCNQEWDDIQDRLKEKDTEIERLKAKDRLNEKIWEDHNEKIRGQRQELRSLLSRAADALDIMTQLLLISDIAECEEQKLVKENTSLIAQLRKALE